jgi:hypothetical protein
MLEIISLVCAIALWFWMPSETNKVIGGWVNKRFKGTHAEFVKAHRKQLSFMFGFGIVIGIAMLGIAAVEFTENDVPWNGWVKVGIAVAWGVLAVIAQRMRAALDRAIAEGRIPMATTPKPAA